LGKSHPLGNERMSRPPLILPAAPHISGCLKARI
jgi:hypothetical protein